MTPGASAGASDANTCPVMGISIGFNYTNSIGVGVNSCRACLMAGHATLDGSRDSVNNLRSPVRQGCDVGDRSC